MNDGELADAILRKIASSREGGMIVERGEATMNPGQFYCHGLIDSSWFDLTDEEHDYLARITSDAP